MFSSFETHDRIIIYLRSMCTVWGGKSDTKSVCYVKSSKMLVTGTFRNYKSNIGKRFFKNYRVYCAQSLMPNLNYSLCSSSNYLFQVSMPCLYTKNTNIIMLPIIIVSTEKSDNRLKIKMCSIQLWLNERKW